MIGFCDLRMHHRDAPRVKNPGGQVVLGGDNVSPLVEIGLTDPPKSGGRLPPPASHLAACLVAIQVLIDYRHTMTEFVVRVLLQNFGSKHGFEPPLFKAV